MVSVASGTAIGDPVEALGETRSGKAPHSGWAELSLLRSAVEHVSDIVLITEAGLVDDPGPRIVYVNPAFTKETGYSTQEVIGLTPRILQPPGADRAPLDEIRRSMLAWQPCTVELLNQRKDGTLFWSELTITPVANATGWYTHWVAVQRDVTARKELENARIRDLARIAEQRTRLLEQARSLEAARVKAESANEAKSQFLANMSHEIRTPLNGVLGMAALMERTKLTSEQASFLETIRASGQSLLAIISDILDLSKIESGHIELERAPFSPHEGVESALAVGAATAHAKGLMLWSDVDASVPLRIEGDLTRFRQVLMNLVGNAVKFTEQGEVSVRLQAAGDTLEIEVADTGPGIAPERHDQVFEAFSQADASTTRRHGGTGLGLTIARRIVQASGGRIDLQSTVAEGSRFLVLLPLVPCPAPTNTPLQGLRASVVVAHDGVRRMVVGKLESMGCAVSVDGEQAEWCVFQGHPPTTGQRLIQLVVPGETEHQLAEAVVMLPATDAGLRAAFTRGDKPAAEPPRNALRLNVLVAEDNAVNELVICKRLRQLGHEVDVAQDGARAEEALMKRKYDLVLMDLQMPKQSGLEVTQAYRRVGGTTPIVALTANAQQDERQHCLENGMDDYLTKPLRFEELDAVLKRVADNAALPAGQTACQS